MTFLCEQSVFTACTLSEQQSQDEDSHQASFRQCFPLFGCQGGRGRMQSEAESTAKAAVTAFQAKVAATTE